MITAFKQINLIYFLFGILFLIFGFLIRIWKWQILTNSIGTEVSFKSLARMSAKGIFLGIITPGKLGEFWRAKYLSDEAGIAGGKAFYTAFVDRLLDLLVVGVVSFFGLVVIYMKFARTQNRPLVALILFLFMLLVYFFARKKDIKILFGALIKFLIPSFLKERANSFLNEFYQGFESLKLRLFSKVLFFGFLYYFFGGALVAYLMALALGIPISFWYIFLITAIIWLVAIVPVTVLGLGTREVAFIYFFSFLGIPAPLAVALSLLFLFCDALIAIPGAILFLKPR